MTKTQIINEFDSLEITPDEIKKGLFDYFASSQLEGFIEHLKEERGIVDEDEEPKIEDVIGLDNDFDDDDY